MSDLHVEIRLLNLPIRAGLAAAHDERPGNIRALTVIRLTDGDGRSGWGECSALSMVGYSPESATTAFELLANDPRLGTPDAGTGLTSEAPMAMAALEMAEIDLRLSAAGVSLAEYMGVDRQRVPAGAAVSLGSIAETLTSVAEAVADGFGRVKLKVVPRNRHIVDSVAAVAAVCAEFPTLEIHVDGNGAFDRTSAGEVEQMVVAGASVVEQPFAATDPVLAAELVANGATVLADEAATSLIAVKRLLEAGACSGVVVKSSRLGGLFNSFEVLGWCEDNGVPAAAGGMQESGLGRAALAVVAAHDACTVTGDIGPARRWLAADPWNDVEMVDGLVIVPSGPGLGPETDVDALERLTVRKAERVVGTNGGDPE